MAPVCCINHPRTPIAPATASKRLQTQQRHETADVFVRLRVPGGSVRLTEYPRQPLLPMIVCGRGRGRGGAVCSVVIGACVEAGFP
jgi:hypothetical protein